MAVQVVSGHRAFFAFFETTLYDTVQLLILLDFHSICAQLETVDLLSNAFMYPYTYGCGISLNMASLVTSPRSWQWPRNERH